MAMGFGLGGFLAPVVGTLIDTVGWRWTAIGSAIVIMVVGQLLAGLFVRHPKDKGMLVDGGPAAHNEFERFRRCFPTRCNADQVPSAQRLHRTRGVADSLILGPGAGPRRSADGRVGDDGLLRDQGAGD